MCYWIRLFLDSAFPLNRQDFQLQMPENRKNCLTQKSIRLPKSQPVKDINRFNQLMPTI